MRILAPIVISLVLGVSASAAPWARPQKKPSAQRATIAKPAAGLLRGRAPVARVPLAQHRKGEVETWTIGKGRHHHVVFLHGLGGTPDGPMIGSIVRGLERNGLSAQITAPLLREVERGERGQITRERTQTMSEQLRHARAAILAQPGKVVLLGHSFGAKATLLLAREFPEKISAIVAIAPSVKMLYAYWKRISGERGLAAPDHMGRVLDQYQGRLEEHLRATADPERRAQVRESLKYHEVMRDLVRYDEAKAEIGVKVPMLVIHGVADAAVSVHYVRRFAESNKKVKLVTYEQSDHHLMGPDSAVTQEVRADVARRIAEFIEKND